MKTIVPIDIITCPQWRAKPPNCHIEVIGKSSEFVLHHTNGHVRQLDSLPTTSRAEAIRYAQVIQDFHMDDPPAGRGWCDSGHNFLVCRSGFILQGRWFTVSAITQGKMVRSAHSNSNEGNQQIGIEFEHNGQEEMTTKQVESGARLMAWVTGQYQRKTILTMRPHSFWTATSCPVNLVEDIPRLRSRALSILQAAAV